MRNTVSVASIVNNVKPLRCPDDEVLHVAPLGEEALYVLDPSREKETLYIMDDDDDILYVDDDEGSAEHDVVFNAAVVIENNILSASPRTR